MVSQLWPSLLWGCCRPDCCERAQILPNVSCSDGVLYPFFFPRGHCTSAQRGLCSLPSRSRDDMPTGKQHQGYQHITPLGQLLAPTCDYHAMLGQARSSTYSTVLFAVKDQTKKPAVPRIKPIEEKHPKSSLYLNVHELKLK